MIALSQSITHTLKELSDSSCREFAMKIIPGQTNILGVRIPKLRKLAQELIKRGQALDYIKQCPHHYCEETILAGILIGKVNTPIEEIIDQIDDFLPHITNWSICDTFCAGLKCTQTNPSQLWPVIEASLGSPTPYTQRFGIVMGLLYFTHDPYVDQFLTHIISIPSDHYYVQMAIAWALATIYLTNPTTIYSLLQSRTLSPTIHKQTIRKILDSTQVSKESKQDIRQLR